MRTYRILMALGALVLSALACTIFIGGPEPTEAPVPVSDEAVESLRQQVEQAWQTGATTGTVSLQISETQLTSYLASWLARQSEPMFYAPQVYLRDGQMRIYGKVRQGYFVAGIGIVVAMGVDENGKPKIEILSADFGPWPVPEGLNNALSAMLQEAYTGAVGPVATGLRLTSVTIADGNLTLTGQIR